MYPSFLRCTLTLTRVHAWLRGYDGSCSVLFVFLEIEVIIWVCLMCKAPYCDTTRLLNDTGLKGVDSDGCIYGKAYYWEDNCWYLTVETWWGLIFSTDYEPGYEMKPTPLYTRRGWLLEMVHHSLIQHHTITSVWLCCFVSVFNNSNINYVHDLLMEQQPAKHSQPLLE